MSRSQRDAKGGKRVKKEQQPSRRGIRRMFLTCCILAIILLALWQTGMLPFPQQSSDPTPSSGITSAEPDTSAPDNTQPDTSTPDKADASTDQTTQETDTPWNLILVNRWHPLPEGYQPQLMTLSNGKQVDERIYPSLQKMFDKARSEGVYPIVASAYRTAEKQQSIMDEKIAEYKSNGYSDAKAKTEAEKWVAIPGTSEHQLGLAVDINADGVNSAGYEVYDWLDKHAYEYGFIRRFPESKTDITGVANEPWHYRYVGKKVAAEIHDRGICLEEYLNQTEHD
jgi:zinc D-Ala-D-Ala carboxypeptidase